MKKTFKQKEALKIRKAHRYLGLITVLSGFLLWFVSSKTLKKIKLS